MISEAGKAAPKDPKCHRLGIDKQNVGHRPVV